MMIRAGILVLFFLPGSIALAQDVQPVPPEVSALADEAVSLVLRNLPQRSQRPLFIAVEGLQTEGRETRLGEFFAMTVTSRLANANDSRIKVLANQHLGALEGSTLIPPDTISPEGRPSPNYIVNGKLYLADRTLFAAVQLVHLPDVVVAGGFELSFPATAAVRELLSPGGAAGVEGVDYYEPDSREQARDLSPGEQLTGHTIMPQGDEDWFIIGPGAQESPGLLSIYTRGSTDTYIEVYGPDDLYDLVAENDDSDDQNARVSILVESGQTFWVKVRGYDVSTTGSYVVTAEIETFGEDLSEPNNRMEDATSLELDGEFYPGLIMPQGDEDWYSIDVPRSAGERILLTVETAGEMDTLLDLFEDDRVHIIEDDDSGDESNARISIMLERPGRYYLRVKHFDDSGTGPYGLRALVEHVSLDRFEPDGSMEEAVSIELDGDEQLRTFIPAGDVDWIRFSLPSGKTVVIETGGSSDTVMTLFDSEGNVVAEDDDGGQDANARIQRYLPIGIYYLQIRQYEEEARTGAEYILRITSR